MVGRLTPDPYQLPPSDPWDLWIFKGGRGSGKTLGGADFIRQRLEEEGAIRVGVMAPTNDDARLTCAEGETGLITLYPDLFTKYNRSTYEAWTRYGGYVRFLGSEKPERWNGPQWNYLWVDEAELCNPLSLEQADFGLRLGAWPKQVWTTTPKGSRYVKRIQSQAGVKVTRATIYDNSHLDPRVRQRWENKYKGTALGKSQLEGLDLDVPEGACWPLLGLFRERYLRPMPEGLTFKRHLGGMDWGTSESHLASAPIASVTNTGEIWVRRWYRSPTGSSKQMIDWIASVKGQEPGGYGIPIAAIAIDRSQWSLADWVEQCGIVALKGDRDVEWRVGLVLGELEKERLFFDSTDPDVCEAYDFLASYHRYEPPHPRAGQIEEVEDDDADALAYLIAEATHPTIDAIVAGTTEHHEAAADRHEVSPYRFTGGTPPPPPPSMGRNGSSYSLPGRGRA